MKKNLRLWIVLAALILSPALWATNYGDVVLTYDPINTKGYIGTEVWDLTAGDLIQTFTLDLSGITDTIPGSYVGPVTLVGMTEPGGVTLWEGNIFTHHDTHNLGHLQQWTYDLSMTDDFDWRRDQMWLTGREWGGVEYYDATEPNTIVTPFGVTDIGQTLGFHYDRNWFKDGQEYWIWADPNYNTETEGVYTVTIKYHACSPTLGTMFAYINPGVAGANVSGAQGLYTNGKSVWDGEMPNIYPVGCSFDGDMTELVAFAGTFWSSRNMGTITVNDLTVERDCPVGDLSGDCKVDLADLAIMAANWLSDNNP